MKLWEAIFVGVMFFACGVMGLITCRMIEDLQHDIIRLEAKIESHEKILVPERE